MPKPKEKIPLPSLTLCVVTREDGQIVSKFHVITGPVLLCEHRPPMPIAWRNRAIPLSRKPKEDRHA